MTPAQRREAARGVGLAAACLAPALILEKRELDRGPDGWPYSRVFRLVFRTHTVAGRVALGAGLGAGFAWFYPHIAEGGAAVARAVADGLENASS